MNLRDDTTHEWIISTLGHGELMCRNCRITNREAAALGKLTCDAPVKDKTNAK